MSRPRASTLIRFLSAFVLKPRSHKSSQNSFLCFLILLFLGTITKKTMAEEQSGKKQVMVAMDESDSSKRALQWALVYLKDSLADSDIILFSAQPPLDLSCVYASSYGAAPMELINSLQENHKNAGLNRLAEGIKICAESGVCVTPKTVMEFGQPKEAICEAVEKLGVDLLIVGSNGKGTLERTFLGSVSNYCVNHAKCPVLVVRTKA